MGLAFDQVEGTNGLHELGDSAVHCTMEFGDGFHCSIGEPMKARILCK
jgi:hypothetical protein